MVASVVVRAAEVIAKGSGVPLWQRRSARAMVGVDGVTPSTRKRACGKRSTFCHVELLTQRAGEGWRERRRAAPRGRGARGVYARGVSGYNIIARDATRIIL